MHSAKSIKQETMAKCILVALTILVSFAQKTSSVKLEQDLSITWEQKEALDKLKEMALPIVPHEYMKEDIYLIRWLRARNFNVDNAMQMLLQNLKWREENRMDTIMEEDFSEIEKDFKYYINAISYDGNPVAYFDLGSFDARSLSIRGLIDKGSRYLERYLEDITSLVRRLGAEGKNVTQYDFIVNMEGQNLVQHTCLRCMPAYVKFINTYESYFTGYADKMIFINTNSIFSTILNSLKPVASPQTREALEIYGMNKQEWQKRIFALIPREQLPIEIGGEAFYGDFR